MPPRSLVAFLTPSRRPRGNGRGEMVVQERKEALERAKALYAFGRSRTEIIEALCAEWGMSGSQASHFCAQAKAALAEYLQQDTSEHTAACVARLLSSIEGAMRAQEYHAHAALEDRLIRLLGLAKPERIEVAARVLTVSPTAADIARRLSELASGPDGAERAIIHEVQLAFTRDEGGSR